MHELYVIRTILSLKHHHKEEHHYFHPLSQGTGSVLEIKQNHVRGLLKFCYDFLINESKTRKGEALQLWNDQKY